MTDYADLSEVDALYREQEDLNHAIEMLDAGGTISVLTVVPPAAGMPTPTLPVAITTVDPISLLKPARNALAARSREITRELEGHGVTGGPPGPDHKP
jgi:hypothetical protein